MNFNKNRPCSLDAGEHAGARYVVIPAGQEQRRWIGDLGQAGAGHLENADFVRRAIAILDRAQDPELVAAVALEIKHRVDHVLQHPGAGDLSVLGDVADEDQREALAFGQPDQFLRRGADLGHGAGRRFQAVHEHRLDRINDHQIGSAGPSGIAQRCRDIAHRGGGGQADVGVGEVEPVGAQPQLVDRLLTGDIDRGQGLRQGGGDLQQQGRFADAGVATDQECRAGDHAAAGNAVEFLDPGDLARRVGRFALQPLKFDLAAFFGS